MLAALFLAGSFFDTLAAKKGTKAEAEVMVKKAVAFLKPKASYGRHLNE